MDNKQVVTGKFLAALPTEQVGQNNFLVRKFYVDLTTNPDWPNTPEFKLKGDKVTLVDNLQKGQTLQIQYNIEGRKYRNRETSKESVITDLVAWKIDVVQLQSSAAPRPAPAQSSPTRQAATQTPPGSTAAHQAATTFANFDEDNNDLPF